MPSLPSKDFRLDDHAFRVTALPWRKGSEALVRIMNTFGPAIGALQTGGETGVAQAAAELFTRLKPADLDWMLTTFLLPNTEIEREHGYVRLEKLPLELDALFAGNYAAVVQILAEHLVLNYASFLAGVAGIARQV